MYSKQEASQLKKDFWTAFGQYMSPVLSAEGEKINWINYKTGEKDVYFKMNADAKTALIGIELTYKDSDIQQIYFEQLRQLKKPFEEVMGEEWTWTLHKSDESGKNISSIYKRKEDVSIFKKEDWPDLISFFKPRIIALDEFWNNFKYSLEALR